MKKYILITGGTGFIGSHLVEKLLNENKKIVLLKRSFSNVGRIKHLINNSNLVLIDIDKVSLSNIFNSYTIEGIFHLATYYIKNHNSKDISNMMDSNITFPTNLLENAVHNNVNYFINTGSFAEYSLKDIPINENSLICPNNLYSSTKVAFEDILKFYCNNYGISACSMKLFTPYGPKDDENKIVPYMISNAIKGNKITIKSTSKILDFIFVQDIVAAFIKAKENVQKFSKYEEFNVASGRSYSNKEIYTIIESMLGKQDVEFFESDLKPVKVNISKIEEKLNWKPKYSIEKGLEETINYYKLKYDKN